MKYCLSTAGVLMELDLKNFNEIPASYIQKGIPPGGEPDFRISFLRTADPCSEEGSPAEGTSARKLIMTFDRENRRAACSFKNGAPMRFVVERAINRSLYTFQEELDLVIIHAASVVIGGKASLFIAPSGGGKSTIASMASSRGMTVIGDDTVLVKRRNGKFYARRFPSPNSQPAPDMFEVDAVYLLGEFGINRLRYPTASRFISFSMCEAFNFYDKDLSAREMAGLKRHVFMFLNDLTDSVRRGDIDFDLSGDIFTCLQNA